jgi:hypothetical protein
MDQTVPFRKADLRQGCRKADVRQPCELQKRLPNRKENEHVEKPVCVVAAVVRSGNFARQPHDNHTKPCDFT